MIEIKSKSKDAWAQLNSAVCDEGEYIHGNGCYHFGEFTRGWVLRSPAGHEAYLGKSAKEALAKLRNIRHVFGGGNL
jgi:hypothetical protein